MYCPEGYFTPLMLLNEFQRSLERDQISRTVFGSSNVDFNTIEAVHKNVVRQSTALLFLHHFISSSASEIRLCNPKQSEVIRVDPWAAKRTAKLPIRLVTTAIKAEKQRDQLEKTLAFIEPELWVLDFTDVDLPKPHSKTFDLVRRFDGWSICFLLEHHPKDVGSYMNRVALSFSQKIAVETLPRAARGAPNKVDQLVRVISQKFPEGVKKHRADAVRRVIEDETVISFSDGTLRKAINQVAKNAN